MKPSGGLARVQWIAGCLRLSALQQEVLDIARQLVVDLGTQSDCEIEERKSKLEQLKSVLEM